MTNKQKIFITYLLSQIGITESNFSEKYLNYLRLVFPREMKSNGFNQLASQYIEFLLDEVNLKKNKHGIKEKVTVNIPYTATDLSNYGYCPVSYSIYRSFTIEHPNVTESTEIGKRFHEELLLIKKIDAVKASESCIKSEVYNNDTLSKIINSKLIFSGHSDEKRIFINKEENYTGTPDYIFQNNEGNYFIVEEKFHRKKDYRKLEESFDKELEYREYQAFICRTETLEPSKIEGHLRKAYQWSKSKINFYPNHELQTISYIKNIQDYDIKYGYLIYWFYDYKAGSPYIHRVEIKRIESNVDSNRQYNYYMTQLVELVKKRNQIFDLENLHPHKCAACVVSKYCSHKTGLYDNFNFPYSKNDIKIFSVKFPDELIKKES